MKQKYEKPQFLAESFVLTQSIALGCGSMMTDSANFHSPSTCGWLTGIDMGSPGIGFNFMTDGNMDIIFAIGATKCDIQLTNDEAAMIYGVCYNNPDGAMKAFAS